LEGQITIGAGGNPLHEQGRRGRRRFLATAI